MRLVLLCLMVLGLLVGCGADADDTADGNGASGDESDDPSPAEMLAQLDTRRSESAYEAQLGRLATACGMTSLEVADLAVHAATNVAPDNGVEVSISELLDAIETNDGGPVSCDEVAAATITLMMGG